MDERISNFDDFFAYYLGEHRNATCRALHFIGTSGFFALIGYTLWVHHVFGISLGVIGALGWVGVRHVEAKRNAAPILLAMVGVAIATPPHVYVLAGIFLAYAMAWIGHFKIEHNRPATFTYPLWSLVGDFKMWAVMARGQLWTGDSLEWLDKQGIPRP